MHNSIESVARSYGMKQSASNEESLSKTDHLPDNDGRIDKKIECNYPIMSVANSRNRIADNGGAFNQGN